MHSIINAIEFVIDLPLYLSIPVIFWFILISGMVLKLIAKFLEEHPL